MRLVFFNTLYHPHAQGGAERSVRFLAEGLVQDGHQVTVASLAPDSEHSGARDVNGVDVRYMPLRNVYWPFGGSNPTFLKAFWHAADIYNPLMTRQAAELLAENQPDLVHTHNLAGFSTGIWRTAKARGLPVVHTVRDYYLLCPRTSMYRNGANCPRRCWDCRLFSSPKTGMTRLVDGVVGISRFVLRSHLECGQFPGAIRRVIYNPYTPSGPGNGQPHRGTGPLRVGYLGRLTPRKGIEVLLEVFATLPIDRFELLVAGAGASGYEAELRRTFARPNIRFLGFVAPRQLLGSIDVLVVPSLWHEPLGRTVIEAYAHGVPVVAARRGGIPELVDEGETGLVFDPDEPEELGEQLRALGAHAARRREMGGKAAAKAREYLPDRIAGQYLAFYRLVMSQETGSTSTSPGSRS